MATGACGISCDACRLRLLEICSTCGPGTSQEAQRKLEAQKAVLGSPCPILACASLNRLEYCTRDCDSFPCENFRSGPYPFSQGFLSMQERRRQQKPPAVTHNRVPVEVPAEYWDELRKKDVGRLCAVAQVDPGNSGGVVLRFLNEDLWVDTENGCLKRLAAGRWENADDPLLELVTLLYLLHADAAHPPGKEIVGTQDLKEAHYFKGPHALPIGPLVERYGNDPEGFRRAASHLGGKPVDMADASFVLLPFPRIPLYYLLWVGDDEFAPKLSVLFNRSIESWLSASGIWALVKLASTALLVGPKDRAGAE